MAKLGRRSTYDPTRHPRLVENLCLLGASDAEIANALKINQNTLYEWQKLYPEITESITRGKVEADGHVARSLYHRALGYSHKAVKIFVRPGVEEPVKVEYIEHYPPDTNAASLWLRNRRGKRREADEPVSWSDRIEHGHSGTMTLAMLVETAIEMRAGRDDPKLVNGADFTETADSDQDVVLQPDATQPKRKKIK